MPLAQPAIVAAALGLRILTLNLHGYHPMGEAPRFAREASGRITPVQSEIYAFTREEITRGHARRVEALSRDLRSAGADLMLFQEVGAGGPDTAKTCAEFTAPLPARGRDPSRANSVLRLQARMRELGLPTQVALACRANVGWVTNPRTFAEAEIVRPRSTGGYETIFRPGDDPYPRGILVEGMAILARAPWRIEASHDLWLERGVSPGQPAESFFTQLALVARGTAADAPRVLVANVHGGHKLRNFEEAVALRIALERVLVELRARGRPVAGLLVGGDFNASLFRPALSPDRRGEVGMAPWELRVPGQFDVTPGLPGLFERLVPELLRLDADPAYKPWASLANPAAARTRAVAAAEAWATSSPALPALVDSIEAARRTRSCPVGAVCEIPRRIDHLLSTLDVAASAIAYANADHYSLAEPSDHPAVWADFRLPARWGPALQGAGRGKP